MTPALFLQEQEACGTVVTITKSNVVQSGGMLEDETILFLNITYWNKTQAIVNDTILDFAASDEILNFLQSKINEEEEYESLAEVVEEEVKEESDGGADGGNDNDNGDDSGPDLGPGDEQTLPEDVQPQPFPSPEPEPEPEEEAEVEEQVGNESMLPHVARVDVEFSPAVPAL